MRYRDARIRPFCQSYRKGKLIVENATNVISTDAENVYQFYFWMCWYLSAGQK